MKPEQRYQIIINYIKENGNVDCLNKDFVDYYVDNTQAKVFYQPYGANKCPQLQRDLAAMTWQLKRNRVGIEGMAGMGFPKWVWSYKLRKSNNEFL